MSSSTLGSRRKASHPKAGGDKAKATDPASIYAERWAAEADALRERLIFMCENLAPSRGRYAYLESRTAISASRWKNVFLGRQMPTIEMLVAMCHYRRDYALWLMTGLSPADDVVNGDRAPAAEEWSRFVAHRAWVSGQKSPLDESGAPGVQ